MYNICFNECSKSEQYDYSDSPIIAELLNVGLVNMPIATS